MRVQNNMCACNAKSYHAAGQLGITHIMLLSYFCKRSFDLNGNGMIEEDEAERAFWSDIERLESHYDHHYVILCLMWVLYMYELDDFPFALMLPLYAFTSDSCWVCFWSGDWPLPCCVDKGCSASYSTSCTILPTRTRGLSHRATAFCQVRSGSCVVADVVEVIVRSFSETGGPQDYPTVDGLPSSRGN